MATASKLKEDYLTCIICSDVYTNPATLQCDHTFCRLCLLEFTKTQPDALEAKSLPCPVCRQMTTVTSPDTSVDEWVNQVKPSRMIQGLMDDFGSDLEQIDMQICRVCKEEGETTPATAWCSVCKVILCDKCLLLHQRLPISQDHIIERLLGKVEPKTAGRFMCKIHEEEQVKLFCKDCKQALCHTCCSIKHRTCKSVITIEEGLTEVTSTLLRKKQAYNKQVTLYANNISKRNSQQEDISRVTAEIETEIKLNSEKAVEMIRAKERKLMSEVETIRNKQMNQLKTDVAMDESNKEQYLQKTLRIDQAINSGTQQEIYDTYEAFESRKQKPDTETDSSAEFETISIAKGTSFNIDDTNSGIRTTTQPQITFQSDVAKMSEAIDNVQLGQLRIVKRGQSIKSKTLLKTIDTMTGQDNDTPSITDVVVVEQAGMKIIVVVDKTNNNIKSFYTEDNQPRQSVLALDGKPFGIANMGDNQVVVTSPSLKCVMEISVYPTLKLLMTIPVGKGCHGIAKMSKHEMVVCRNGMVYSSVDFLDMKGTLLRTLSKNVVKFPYSPCLTSKGSILVSDRGFKSLVFISAEGTLSHSFKPTGDQALIQPRGVATTESGEILLVDKDAKKVIQLTESGMLVRDILTTDDGLDKPYGICVDREGLVYVSCGRYVKVFKCFK